MPTKEQAKEEQKEKRRSKKKEEQKKNNQIEKRRAFPLWQRFVVLTLLSILALIVGAIVGYGVIGDGEPIDALKISTWKHIIDIIRAE